MAILAWSIVASLIVTFIILKYEHLHKHLTSDSDLIGVQKFHDKPVPRIGGIAVFCGLVFGMLVEYKHDMSYARFGFMIILSAAPAFLVGLIEDITKRVSIGKRLASTCISAILGGVLVEGWIIRLDVSSIDYFLDFLFISILFTSFAVAGVSNAFNIIDGYNGLSGMVAIIILSGLSYVAGIVGDVQVQFVSISIIGAIIGFFVFNYPYGLIFLGDGGAYLIGFIIAELSILLVSRNSAVSAWFPLMLVFYPIFETIFTIFRRLIFLKKHPSLPDAEHLHQLVYSSLVIWAVRGSDERRLLTRNSLTSPYLWVVAICAAVPAIIFWNDTQILMVCVFSYALFYISIYYLIFTKRLPDWLKIK